MSYGFGKQYDKIEEEEPKKKKKKCSFLCFLSNETEAK